MVKRSAVQLECRELSFNLLNVVEKCLLISEWCCACPISGKRSIVVSK